MKKINYLLLVLILGILLHFDLSAQHFQTIWANNPYMPMSIIVDSAQLDSIYLQVNDEIAVFDIDDTGLEICVGLLVLTEEFLPDVNQMITASADDPTTPDQDGFIDGHNIVYRYWDNSEAIEIILFKKEYNPDVSNVYQNLGTALVGLEGFYALIWTGAADNNWHNSANWHIDNLIPDATIRVLIPAWCTELPIVSASDAECKGLKLEQGANLTVSGNYMLLVFD